MAGHSKWSQIKHKKAKEDVKRGKAFTRLIKEITVAARDGGGDPAGNPRLRFLLEKAKHINMPHENTVRAIKKGTGELPGNSYERGLYEGYGPHGILVLVETLCDNPNRIIAELRHLFTKKGGSLGESGVATWMFDHVGSIRAQGSMDEDALLTALLAYDIIDLYNQDSTFHILCQPRSFEHVRRIIEEKGLTVTHAELEWIAKSTVELPEDVSEKVYDFLQALEEHEDVQDVYTNIA